MFQITTTIHASPERVWSTLLDVERWPQSTTSMTSVERLDRGPFQLGSRARIKQPKLPPLVWTVTDFQPLRGFTWTASSPGAATFATHELAPGPDGTTSVTLAIYRRGPLAALLDLLFGGLTRDYVTREIEGLKRTCEAAMHTASAAT